MLRSLTLALLVVPTLLAAQPAPWRVEQLATGVYAMLRDVPRGNASDSNVLIIINEADVVVVDANIFPTSARQTIAEIRKLTSKPVRYLVNTHWHSDHHYGNQAYVEAFPGIEIIQHAETRAAVIERDIPALADNMRKLYPESIERFRTALSSGRTSQGAVVTDSMRAAFRTSLGLYEFFVKDMSGVSIIPGTLIVHDSIVLRRGDRRIVVKHLGRGNTAGDLVVHLPVERIVATGDLVVHPLPFAFYSHLGDWRTTLRTLARLDAGIIVPGHGAVQRDWSYTNRLAELIESTWTQVRAAATGGAPLDTVRARVNIDRFRDAFAGDDPMRRRAFDNLFTRPAVEAAFKEITTGKTYP